MNALISKQKTSDADLVRKKDVDLDSVNEIITLLFIFNMLFNESVMQLECLIIWW